MSKQTAVFYGFRVAAEVWKRGGLEKTKEKKDLLDDVAVEIGLPVRDRAFVS